MNRVVPEVRLLKLKKNCRVLFDANSLDSYMRDAEICHRETYQRDVNP